MAVMETSSTMPTSPIVPGSEQQQRAVAPTAAPVTAVAAPAPAADTASKPPAPPVSAFGFALRYDQGMQRMILEARDAVTGFVIFQMPTKYVTKQFSAGADAAAESSRGAKLDSAV